MEYLQKTQITYFIYLDKRTTAYYMRELRASHVKHDSELRILGRLNLLFYQKKKKNKKAYKNQQQTITALISRFVK